MYLRLGTGYETIINESGIEYKLEFPNIDSFPYHVIKKTQKVIDTGWRVKNISLRFVSMIMPTSGNSDGEITIEANGTNTPFKYYTTDPRDFCK